MVDRLLVELKVEGKCQPELHYCYCFRKPQTEVVVQGSLPPNVANKKNGDK